MLKRIPVSLIALILVIGLVAWGVYYWLISGSDEKGYRYRNRFELDGEGFSKTGRCETDIDAFWNPELGKACWGFDRWQRVGSG
ncbi:hypothetical protein [Thalassolituus sp.]|uniref:hypothetical protein n=1 Tax=Thalassolituus sp. TaxID=2030822 RepID=UPI00351926E5